MSRTVNISVIGGGTADGQTLAAAYEVGRLIARQGWTLICGGLGGVMEAACKGATENEGTTVGILPTYKHGDANPYVTVAIPTGMGHARNAIVAAAGHGVLAVGGEHGTLSEMALAIKMGKPVAALHCRHAALDGVTAASTPEDAIGILKQRLA